MWFYKLLLLLALIATWIPRESKSFTFNSYEQGSHTIMIDFEEPEEQEEDEGEEELAA
jgi:hypothetical protein